MKFCITAFILFGITSVTGYSQLPVSAIACDSIEIAEGTSLRWGIDSTTLIRLVSERGGTCYVGTDSRMWFVQLPNGLPYTIEFTGNKMYRVYYNTSKDGGADSFVRGLASRFANNGMTVKSQGDMTYCYSDSRCDKGEFKVTIEVRVKSIGSIRVTYEWNPY